MILFHVFNLMFLYLIDASYVPQPEGNYLPNKNDGNQTTKLSSEVPQVNCVPVEERKKLDDQFVKAAFKREIVHEIWEGPHKSDLSPLLTDLKDILMEMADSDSFMFVDLAFRISALDASILSRLDTHYPNFCSYATAINSTVEWIQSDNNQYYVDSVIVLTNQIVNNIMSQFIRSLLTEIGCGNITEPKEYSVTCWENGFAARYDELWSYFGNLIPCKLHQIASELVNSIVFAKKAYGTIISFAVQPINQKLFDKADFVGIVQDYFRYAKAAKNTSKCCCLEWHDHMDKICEDQYKNVYDGAKSIIDEVKDVCDGKVGSP